MRSELILLLSAAVFSEGKLSWKNLSKDEFTDEHNLEILKAHTNDPQHLDQILKSKASEGDISMDDTIFNLHTRAGPNEGVRIFADDDGSLSRGKFDPSKPTFFLTHGFLSSPGSSWVIVMKNEQLKVLDCNFITIDWSSCASNIFYPTAVNCVPNVGTFLAEIIKFLQAKGNNEKKMHLIAHSLGAHVMGQVALHGIRVSRITGLDPAGPLFRYDDTDGRIDPNDADLVDIIHTSKGILGYEDPLGHWDFYPNGGKNQPGCIIEACEHSMSHDFYIETISNNRIYPAMKCSSMEAGSISDCNGPTAYMGVLGTEGATGIYYSEISTAPTQQISSDKKSWFQSLRDCIFFLDC